jgi:hypothetical protein
METGIRLLTRLDPETNTQSRSDETGCLVNGALSLVLCMYAPEVPVQPGKYLGGCSVFTYLRFSQNSSSMGTLDLTGYEYHRPTDRTVLGNSSTRIPLLSLYPPFVALEERHKAFN